MALFNISTIQQGFAHRSVSILFPFVKNRNTDEAGQPFNKRGMARIHQLPR
jgi:hypothetical protein